MKNKYENKDFLVKKSLIPGAGMGLFTKRPFRKGESLGPYQGQLLTEDECNKYPVQDHVLDISNMEKVHLTDRIYIYPPQNMLLRYINHSPVTVSGKRVTGKKAYNVVFHEISIHPYVEIVANKDIAKGDEVYLTYGTYFTRRYLTDNPKAQKFFLS